MPLHKSLIVTSHAVTVTSFHQRIATVAISWGICVIAF